MAFGRRILNTSQVEAYRIEVDRLLSLEKGNSVDASIRLVGLPLGGILYYFFAASLLGITWAALYVVSYLFFRKYISSLGSSVSSFEHSVVHALIVFLTVSFLWFPAYLLVNDNMYLCLIGTALTASQLMHLVHRGDTDLQLIVGLILAAVGTTLFFLLPTLPSIESPLILSGVVLSWTALSFYLAQSMLAARARILAREEANRASAQSQKLSALGQLAGGVAHDFNNALTAISGNLQLYRELEDPVEKREVLDAAERSCEHAAAVVRQILVYARKSPTIAHRVSANTVLERVSELTHALIPANIQTRWDVLDTPEFLFVDMDQVVTAVVNLIVNSLDAMEEGGCLEARVFTCEDPDVEMQVGTGGLPKGRYVAYCVKDSGHGIPENMLKTVADPFVTTKPVGKGTGLGLSMASAVSERMGGGMTIASSTSGTEITLYFPAQVTSPNS
ncbi:MAG: ATP-binding protein [Pseudomonadota bacterium]